MLCVIGCGNAARSDDGVGVYVAQALLGFLRRLPRPDVRVFDAGYSLHDFRWQHALTAGRRIFAADFPDDVTVFLIEAASLAFGLELSASVRVSADRVIDEIREIIVAIPHPDTPRASPEIAVARGNFYLSREICEAYLPGVVSVALLARDDQVLIVPLTQQSAGGLLLKQRNARGDRVIHAQEFFRNKDLPELFELRTVPVCWSQDCAALVVSGLFKTQGLTVASSC